MTYYSDIGLYRTIQHLYTCTFWNTKVMPCNDISVALGWPWLSLEEESKLASKLLLSKSTHIPQLLEGSVLEEGSWPRC